MSSIVQLTIQGIRSFGTKAEDKQSITFSSPVTLILGANGCGKTTVIECLKYALTGELPPGSDHGKSFVHDPKIFDAMECIGQVKLQVKNIRGQTLTVTRAVKITQKRGRAGPNFMALDSTITYGNNEGQSISKRAIDVDNELERFMGVSKAIINNVIFCHQENACWPLDEPKKLKEKFDAIFGTSNYDKAIEKMIKIKKLQQDSLKLKRNDLRYAEVRKKEADTKNLDLANSRQKKEDLLKQSDQFDNDLIPVEERIKAVQKIEIEIGSYNGERIKLKADIKSCEEHIKSLTSKIKKEFDGSVDQIDIEIRNFHENMEEKKSELKSLEDLLNRIKNQERKLRSSLTDLEHKRSTLLSKRQLEQEYVGKRAKKISDLCEKLEIPVSIDIENAKEDEVLNIYEQIGKAFVLEDKKISELSEKHDKTENEKQTEIDKCRENKVTIESDIQSKRGQKSKLQQDLKKVEDEINQNEASAKKLASITAEVEKADKLLKTFEEKVNFEDKEREINDKKSDIKTKEEQYRELDKKLTFLNSISKKVIEVNLKEQQLEKKEQEIRKVKNKHGSNIKTIFPDKEIESNYKKQFQNINEEIQKQIKDLQEKENENRLKLNSLEVERKNKREELSKWENDHQQNSDKIFDKCHGTPYEEILQRSKENVEKYQLELGALKSSESMFKKYMKNINDDPCCPLCHKNLSNDEATDLTAEMAEEIRRVPANIKKTEQSLKKEQHNYESLMGLRSIIDKNTKLEEDIPKRKEDLKKLEDQLSELSKDIESCQLLIAEPSSNLDLVNSMLGDMALLDEALKDASRIKDDLQSLKEKLPKEAENLNIDDIQTEKDTVSTELDTNRKELEKLENDYRTQKSDITRLKETKLALKDNQIKLQEGIQALPQLKSRYDEISKNLDLLSKEIETLEEELNPLKSKLDNLIKEKENLKTENRTILNKSKSKLDGLKKINHEVESLNKELKNLAEENLEEEIENLKELFRRNMNEQAENGKENTQATEKIENLKSIISNQELAERDLKDNRELKVLQKKNIRLKDQLEAVLKQMGDLSMDTASKERAELIKKRDAIVTKRGQLRGQIGEIESQIKKLDAELKDPKFKDALKNYRRLFYEVEILEQVVHDLNEYHFALDRALSQYHKEKMQKINRLIREFWRQIYRGNDIDYIEIKTESEDTKSSAAKRRTFNYSVVQSKNNTKLEMRGRCSAGQRVLASLIIRMALAETFSSNCGVLALDEPTTNLDRNNIISLCETLSRIIEDRQSQCNFMLIIITHDEEFISALGKIRNYHKVSRNAEGKSVVRQVKLATEM
ncbi:DNA repair protein RAD50 [Condylostylus longicornis]|uniref:DNA repair protein RAD50 n=1 Tax=Condylostylus longicornis TaxID=2530218 RepID=UPI00244E2167|nr:DNA repair protein RAD50 [Condylostylus longicornis]